MPTTRDVTFLLLDDFSHIAFACAVEPLRIANLLQGEEIYRWRLASVDGERAVCSNKTVTLVDQGLTDLAPRSSLFLISGAKCRRPGNTGRARFPTARTGARHPDRCHLFWRSCAGKRRISEQPPGGHPLVFP